MRKTFLKVSLLGALALSMPLAITSCKDYDDDIEVLNQETGDLKTQLSALESALSAAKSEAAAAAQAAQNAKAAADAAANAAAAAQSTGDQALVEAQKANAAAAEAKTEAELAKQAAATAKAEAISEAIAQVNELLKNYPTKADLDKALENYATKEYVQAELNKVASEIAAVDAKLVALDTKLTGEINELTTFKAAAETQIKALEEFKALAEKNLKDLADKFDALEIKVDGISTKVGSLESDLLNLNNSLESVKTSLTEKIEALDTRVKAIEAKLIEQAAAILALQNKDVELENGIANLKSQLENSVANLSEEDKKLAAKDVELAGKIDKLIAEDSRLQGEIDKLIQADKDILATIAQIKADHKTDIDALKKDIASLKAEDTRLAGLIDNLQAELGKVNTNIAALQGKVSTLINLVTARLTSLDFIPTTYVDGIPSIDFSAIQYYVQTANGKDKYTTSTTSVLTSDDKTVAKFNVHPSTVTINDIVKDKVAAVCATAVSRASDPISIVNSNITIENGVLAIPLKKLSTANLNDAGSEKINIVSFEVPLAKVEGVDAVAPIVRSEYVRLTEAAPFNVKLAVNEKAPKRDLHLMAYSDVQTVMANAEAIPTSYPDQTFDCVWDKNLDLTELVNAHKIVNSNCIADMSNEDLAAYGLEIRFHEFKDDVISTDGETNQQDFIIVEGNTVKADPDFVGNKQTLIGRTAIVTVELVDVANGRNNVVDHGYIAVRFTAQEKEDIVVADVIDLGSDWLPTANDNAEFSMTWQDMNTEVLAKYGADGLSHENFNKIYTSATWEVVSVDGVAVAAGTQIGNLTTPNLLAVNTAPSTNSLTWVLTEDDVKTILPKTTKTYVAKVTMSDPKGLNANFIFYVQGTVKLEKPTAGTHSPLNWNGDIYRLLPVQYQPEMANTEKVKYLSDIFAGYINNNLIASAGKPVGTWDVQFNDVQPVTGYSSMATATPDTNDGQTAGYALGKSTTKAAELGWNAGHTAWTTGTFPFVNSEQNAYFRLSKNQVGFDLVGKNVKIGSWVKMNKYNIYEVEVIEAQVVRPINVTNVSEKTFTDGEIGGSKIKASSLVSITDFRGYKVAKAAGSGANKYQDELWNYYGIQDPVFTLNDPKLVVNGKETVSMNSQFPGSSITLDGDNLVFKNPNSNVETSFVVRIPLTLTYEYGTIESYVDVTVNPKNGSMN